MITKLLELWKQGRQRMITKREHEEYADSVVHQRFKELLDKMVAKGEIDPPDRDRFLRKISWLIPLPLNNKRFIDLVSSLQLKQGDDLAKKKRRTQVS